MNADKADANQDGLIGLTVVVDYSRCPAAEISSSFRTVRHPNRYHQPKSARGVSGCFSAIFWIIFLSSSSNCLGMMIFVTTS